MNDKLSIDGVTIEVGDKILLSITPITSKEELIETERNYFARAFIYLRRLLFKLKASPTLDGIYVVSSGYCADATTQLKNLDHSDL